MALLQISDVESEASPPSRSVYTRTTPVPKRIAFLLLVHNDPDQAVRLCRSLAPDAVFSHIEAKATNFERLTNFNAWGHDKATDPTLNDKKRRKLSPKGGPFISLADRCRFESVQAAFYRCERP